ncbi:MAG: arylesterase, partial [Nitrospinales bacterium]
MRSGFSLFFALVFLLIALNANAEEGETTPVIIALGDSLTAGFGVREEESYPARLQVMLKQN